jgi:hypothetical protein
MKKLTLLLFSLAITLALPGTSVMAEPMFMRDVNTACNTGLPVGETKITVECSVCHDLNDFDQYNPNQDLYESHGACEFCPGNADCAPVRPTNEELLADARDTTNQYFETLFAKFMEHMNLAGGDFAAVFPDCSEIAPLIAGDFSRETGYLVRRVTNRTRNARNTPDGWEAKQLEEFEKMAEQGRLRTQFDIEKPDGSTLPTTEFEATAFVNEEDVEYFRYMRSITLPGLDKLPCLKCHGTFDELADGVREAIGVEYPYDLALGYKAGDIRGAWTIKIPIVEGED